MLFRSDEWSTAKAENWKMKECIEKAMKDMGYKTKAEMKKIMRNYNRKKAKQDKEWEEMTSAERTKFFNMQSAIAKLRSDWTKGYDVTRKDFCL